MIWAERPPGTCNQPTLELAISRRWNLQSADARTCHQPTRPTTLSHANANSLPPPPARTPSARGAGRHAGRADPRPAAERQDDAGAHGRGSRGYRYYSFDDDCVRAARSATPSGSSRELPDRVILDEVQRVPALFTALKGAVDRRRVPGRFILTGSANVLLVPALADSLAGRMGLLRLHPLAQCELAGTAPRFLDVLFAGGLPPAASERLGDEPWRSAS